MHCNIFVAAPGASLVGFVGRILESRPESTHSLVAFLAVYVVWPCTVEETLAQFAAQLSLKAECDTGRAPIVRGWLSSETFIIGDMTGQALRCVHCGELHAFTSGNVRVD